MRVLLAILAALAAVYAVGASYGPKAAPHSLRARFAAGRVPAPPPEGPHRGWAPGYRGPWQGKAFDAGRSAGINLFEDARGRRAAYPFRTYVARGLRDPGQDVLRIDYDLPGNPPWLRRILDEIVEVAPGRYVGKVHLRVLPFAPFTAAYFELQRAERVGAERPQAAEALAR